MGRNVGPDAGLTGGHVWAAGLAGSSSRPASRRHGLCPGRRVGPNGQLTDKAPSGHITSACPSEPWPSRVCSRRRGDAAQA